MAESFRDVEPESFESSWASNDNPPNDDLYTDHTDYAVQPSSSVSRRLTRPGMAEDLDVDSEEEDPTPAPSPLSHHVHHGNNYHPQDPVTSPPHPPHQFQQRTEESSSAVDRQLHTVESGSGLLLSSRPRIHPLHSTPLIGATPPDNTPLSFTGISSPLSGGSEASPLSGLQSANASYANVSFSGAAPMKFRRGKLLGQGAYGAVYQAMNVMSGELLAIKQIAIAADTSSSALRDIEREIAINSALPHHSHCVQYRGIQSTSRNIYIIMEHVSGGSIQSLLKSVGRFHENTMRRYAHMTLLGLQHLHHHNVVHQDIKGANVLIDERGIAKIADFGCSRDLSKTTSSASMVGGGTPLWMAPEVCRGEYASKQSDIWSFGCLLLEMTSAEQVPWVFAKGTSAFAVLYAIGAATRPPKPPSHLSPIAADFLSACLQVDRSKRPTVDELLRHPFLHQDGETGCEEWDNYDDDEEEAAPNSDDDMFERGGSVMGSIKGRSIPQPSPNNNQQRGRGGGGETSGGFVLHAVENSPDRRGGGVSSSSAQARPVTNGLVPNQPPRQAHTSSVTGTHTKTILQNGNEGDVFEEDDGMSHNDPYLGGTVWQSGGSEAVGPGDELYNIEELDGKQQKKRKKATSLKSGDAEGTARKLAQKFSCLLSSK